jgi:hypothetical protein
MLKKILLGLVLLLAVLVGVAYLLPREITVTRSAQLASSPDVIFPLLETPAEWPKWSPWNKRDPNMKITYSGPPNGQGAKWAWTSESEGDGEMVITQAVPSVIVNFELTIVGMGPPSTGGFRLAPNASGTVVEWSMTADMGNSPIGRWIGLMMPKWLAKDFDDGLASLNEYAKTRPPGEHIMGVEIPGAALIAPDSSPP